MRKIPATLALFALVLSSPAAPAEFDWSRVDAAFGKKPIVSGAVHKYGLPRSDLRVSLDGVDIKPALALGGWVAFEPMGRDAMMMGDLVLTESEINPVMSSLLAAGVQITGVHNHLLRAHPATFYMHVSAQGDPAKLAQLVRDALGASGTPFEAASGGQQASELGFDAAGLDEALGAHGKNNGGVYQFSFPRGDQIRVGGMSLAPTMGTATAINFEPTGGGKAAISGDFVAEAQEVEPLLKALRSNGVEVTALHNHMLDDEPRLFFVHFWANDDAVKLAHALRAGLDAVHAPERS